MKSRILTSVALVAAAVAAIAVSGQAPPAAPSPSAVSPPDEAAIRKSAADYAEAFNKADAKAIAAMWTANGECRDSDGRTFTGRAAIEQAYAEFFKNNAGAKIEVLVKSIRFPANDMAVEEGLLRPSRGTNELPTSTAYVAVHIRENGQWKVALSAEAADGQDRLEDLDWLLGDWSGKIKDGDVKLSFARDAKKPLIAGTFTKTPTGSNPVSHSVRIALDPETGRIRSWCFEDDGAHSQALWTNDGKSWLLEARGVLANGTPTSETIVIQRVGPDVITWRAIDRIIGDQALPDIAPIRLNKSK
jgi:uncharacterized protein (TIGR02246 family)